MRGFDVLLETVFSCYTEDCVVDVSFCGLFKCGFFKGFSENIFKSIYLVYTANFCITLDVVTGSQL